MVHESNMASVDTLFPLTEQQLGIYLESMKNPASVNSIMPVYLFFEKGCGIKKEKLKAALCRVIDFYPVLKAGIALSGGIPCLVPRPDLKYGIEEIMLGEDRELNEVYNSIVKPFDLQKDALFRFVLVHMPKGMYLFELIHHLLSDGVSYAVFHQNLARAYQGEELIPEQKSAFDLCLEGADLKDSAAYRESREFFERMLADAEADACILPDEIDAETVTQLHKQQIYHLKDFADPAAVRNRIHREGLSKSTLFMAAFAYTLAKMTNQENAQFCMVESGRSGEDVRNTVAMMIKTLPLCISVCEEDSVSDFLSSVQTILKESLKHDAATAVSLADTNEVSADVLFVYQDTFLDGLVIDGYPVPVAKLKDGEVRLSLDVYRTEEDYVFSFEYRGDLYLDETIESFARLYMNILKGFAECALLKEISFTDDAVIKFYEAANENSFAYDRNLTVVDLFRQQVVKYPERPAIIFGSRSITYQEMDGITEKIARFLTRQGVKAEEPVGIMVKRSERFPLSAMGVLKAGAACQPLDFNYPKERLMFMLEDSGAKLVIADSDLADRIEGFNGTVIPAEQIEALPEDPDTVLTAPKADSLFTMIYTSGTTGKPKGCMLEHRNLVNFCLSFCEKFHVTCEDRAAAYGAFGFDASMQDLYPYLTCGASVAVIPEELRLDLPGLNEFVLKHKITMMDCTTQLGRQFITSYPHNPYMRVFTVGGEKLVPCSPPDYRFVNTYGPTECTIYVTDYDVDRVYESVPIGKTFGNCDGYIVDKQRRLLPPGAVGELAISGYPVIRGYLNRPDKNAESFVPNTIFQKEGYERMYLTGDVCRYLTDGNIQFVGRKDDQVKIRGYRIELGGIEKRIREFEGIRDAAVIARDLPDGGKAVAAYLVSDREIKVAELNAFICETLPKYMVPTAVMQIDKIPLTPNGKVDKRKLPEPVFQKKENAASHVMNVLEQDLYNMVTEITGISGFDITDSLIASGLSSLTTIIFAGRLYDKYGFRISVSELMDDDCSLAAVENRLLLFLLEGKGRAGTKEADHRDAAASSPAGPVRLCREQLGVYYDTMKRPTDLVYNIPMMYSFPLRTDAEKLKESVRRVIGAHPVLSVKIELEGKDFVQKPLADVSPEIPVETCCEEELEQTAQEFVLPFSLSEGPLYRMKIVKTEARVVLLLDVHHIVFDGLSLAVFLRELAKTYETGEAPETETAYFRFIKEEEEFENSEKKESAIRYYDGLFADFEEASDITPELSGQPQNALLKEAKTPLEKDRIDRFCRQEGITPAALFLAALFYTVGRCNASRDVFISMISSGRENNEYLNAVGMLVRTLPLHGQIREQITAADYLRDTQKAMLTAIENGIYPAMNVYDRYSFRPRINYACQIGIGETICIEGEAVEEAQIVSPLPKFHISVHIDEKDGQYLVNVQYNDALYSPEYMQTFSAAIAACAENMIEQPEEQLTRISLLNEQEKKRVMSFGRTAECELQIHLFHQLFEKQAELHPDKTALIAADSSYTFAELDREMNRTANALIRRGLEKGDCAAVLLPRESALLISMYAVMKAGAAYIPCDPEYPQERIRYIIENSGAKYIITDRPRGFENEIYFNDLRTEKDCSRPQVPVSPDDTAYLIYTSGSTGKPKGVVIRHEGIANYLVSHPANRHVYACSEEGHVMVSVTTASFDMSLKETALALCNGITLALANEEETQNPALLTALFERCGGDIFNATPSRMEQYMMYPPFCSQLAKCRVVMCGGEKYSTRLLQRLQQTTKAKLFNTYGPTEITVSCNGKDLSNADRICVGKPLLNVTEYIVDADRNLLPVGFTGELYVGGKGVAKGYLNNPEMTKKSFGTFRDEWIYRTGDYARWTQDGDVVILGRTDHQVKLRGLRIELGEVERVILSCPGVVQAVVMIKEIRGTEHLCAYYVDEGSVTVEDLKEFISRILTKYMVPTAYLRMEKMPQTPNGKTDMKALPQPELFQSDDYEEAATPSERMIQKSFEEVLQLEKVSVTDSFFDLGGTSLSATSLLVKLNEQGFEISYGDIFAQKTVRGLASMSGPAGDFEDNLAGYDYQVFDGLLKGNSLSSFRGERTGLGNVLVTGAIGFLGIHIVHLLLEQYDGKVYCLVRDGRLPAEKRILAQYFYYFEKDYSDLLGSRLFVVRGDVTEKGWFEELKEAEINTVINCAALVKHFSDSDDIERTNVGGVQTMIDFSRQHDSLLIQISTGSVAGDRVNSFPAEDIRLTEQSLYYGQLIDNQYVHSKFIGERCVLEAVKEGLRAKIMRVGNLAARSTDGEFQMNFTTNGFMGRLKAYLAIGAFPYSSMDHAIEMAPIDETADAILRLAQTPDHCCIFHPFNNHYIPLGDVILKMKEMGFDIRLTEDDEFEEMLTKAQDDPQIAPLLTTLVAYTNKDTSRKIEAIGVDNLFTTQALYRLGFSWSMTSKQYMEQFLQELQSLGFFSLKDDPEIMD